MVVSTWVAWFLYNIWVEDVQLSNEWCADFPPYYYWIISSIQPFQLRSQMPCQKWISAEGAFLYPVSGMFWEGISAFSPFSFGITSYSYSPRGLNSVSSRLNFIRHRGECHSAPRWRLVEYRLIYISKQTNSPETNRGSVCVGQTLCLYWIEPLLYENTASVLWETTGVRTNYFSGWKGWKHLPSPGTS